MMLVNKKSTIKLRALYGGPRREPGLSPALSAYLRGCVGALAVGAGEPADRVSPCMKVTIGGTVTIGPMLTCCAPKLCPNTDTVTVALSAPSLPPSCADAMLSTAAATCSIKDVCGLILVPSRLSFHFTA